jgi:hypothetical protein
LAQAAVDPLRGGRDAAEGEQVHADYVAGGMRGAVVGDGGKLVGRVGVGHEAHRIHALRAQRAQRSADPAALREAQQHHRIGRPREADVDRDARRIARHARAIVDHARRREGKLRDDVGSQAVRRS